MAPLLKKAARQGFYCDNRHCVSPSDALMPRYSKGSQRSRERRAWLTELRYEAEATFCVEGRDGCDCG